MLRRQCALGNDALKSSICCLLSDRSGSLDCKVGELLYHYATSSPKPVSAKSTFLKGLLKLMAQTELIRSPLCAGGTDGSAI